MAVAAPQSRPDVRSRRSTGSRSAKHPAARRRVANGVVWIVALALLLAGVVALNVAVLRTNLRIDDLSQKRARLRAENATLESKLATAAATARIEQNAARELGLRPADPARTSYLDMAP
jgi:cell division protein FtsL